MNEGCRLALGEWVLLLNPDMTVRPGFLDRVLDVAKGLSRSAPKVGVVGFRLEHADGSPQASCGPFPTLLGTLLGLFRSRRTRKCRHTDAVDQTDVPWVTGCCLLLRRECLEQLGGFDESFFLYYEDVDLCRRARDAGWGVRYEPGVGLMHHSPLHTREVPAGLRLITRHALMTYARKHWPAWQTRMLGWIVALEARYRRRQARRAGQREGEHFHGELLRLVGDMRRDDEAEVGKRLRRAARRLERVARRSDSC